MQDQLNRIRPASKKRKLYGMAVITIAFLSPRGTVAQELHADSAPSTECVPCKTRNEGSPTSSIAVTIPSPVNDLLKYATEAVEKAPCVSSCTATINGTFSGQSGTECCDDASCTAPTAYTKVSGSLDVGESISFTFPGCNYNVSDSGVTPVTWSVTGKALLGPEVTPSVAATMGVSGDTSSSCHNCCDASLAATLSLSVGGGGALSGQIQLFESGHWYSVDASMDAAATVKATGSVSEQGDYHFGSSCTDNPKLTGKVSVGKVTAEVGWELNFDGYGIGWKDEVDLFDGYGPVNFSGPS